MVHEHFAQAIEAAGLVAPDTIHADGLLHRFSPTGKRSDAAGWYVLHDDGLPAGVFGCWRTGLAETWCSKAESTLTQTERDTLRQRVKDAKAQRDADTQQRQQGAAIHAAQRWAAAGQAPDEHPYLVRKGIAAHGLRVEGGLLLVPMRDTNGTVHSLQTIAPDGTKMFMSGGKVKGCYFGIGKPKGALIVCEGFATGASIHECTGHAVAVAFNAGNLEAVAVALRSKYPALKIIIDADDDHQTPGNPGITKAKAAAQTTGATLAVPVFKAVAV